MKPSLTPVEDGIRAQQEATPLPADAFQAATLRVTRAATIEMARLLDQGSDWNRVISLASSSSASIIESIVRTACSTMGIPAAATSIKMQIVQEISVMLSRQPAHHVTVEIDLGEPAGRS